MLLKFDKKLWPGRSHNNSVTSRSDLLTRKRKHNKLNGDANPPIYLKWQGMEVCLSFTQLVASMRVWWNYYYNSRILLSFVYFAIQRVDWRYSLLLSSSILLYTLLWSSVWLIRLLTVLFSFGRHRLTFVVGWFFRPSCIVWKKPSQSNQPANRQPSLHPVEANWWKRDEVD